MAPPLQFVLAQADGRIDDPKTRRTVRKNAMRAFRRSQRVQVVKEFQEKKAQAQAQGSFQQLFVPFSSDSEAGTTPSPDTLETRTPDLAGDHGNHEEDMSLDIGPRLAFDPFSSTLLYNHHDAPELFTHCKHFRTSKKSMLCSRYLRHLTIKSSLAQSKLTLS